MKAPPLKAIVILEDSLPVELRGEDVYYKKNINFIDFYNKPIGRDPELLVTTNKEKLVCILWGPQLRNQKLAMEAGDLDLPHETISPMTKELVDDLFDTLGNITNKGTDKL